MQKLKNIAIIPARGGSKRIPKKNIKLFLGKPIITYSIEAALKSQLFDEVMVSTDDAEIAEIAKMHGAGIFKRSIKNSDDFATLSNVIEEFKEDCIHNKKIYENICCILATAPLITPKIIKEGYDNLIVRKADSLRPVVKFSYPVQRALKLDKGKMSFMDSTHATTRSQDLEPAFFDAGMFYWMQFKTGLKGKKKFAFEIPEMFAQDIDTLEDWDVAEYKFKYLVKRQLIKK